MAPKKSAATAELDTFVETREIAIDQLHRFPGNARRGNVAELKRSLRRHGQYRALIVQDRTEQGEGYRVIAGNHTFDGLVALGRKTVRCEIHQMDDDLAVRVNITDNRQSELGHNDQDAVLQLIGQLGGDLDGTGYDQGDVDAMLASAIAAEPTVAPSGRPAAARDDWGDDDAPADDPDGGGDDQGEEEEQAPAGAKGLGKPVISYQLVFDNEVQQSAWYELLRTLRRRYSGLETIGERVHAFCGDAAVQALLGGDTV